jgi:hypothetical protein
MLPSLAAAATFNRSKAWPSAIGQRGGDRSKRSSLTDYGYHEKEYVIKGSRHGRKFRLGDSVRVKILRINAFCSEIELRRLEPVLSYLALRGNLSG